MSETECIYDLEKDEHPHEERATPRFKSSNHGTPRASGATRLSLSPTVTRSHEDSHGENQRIKLLEQQVKELQKALAVGQSRETPQKDLSSVSRMVSNVLGLYVPPNLIIHFSQYKISTGLHSVDHPIEPYIEIGEESRHSLLGQDASFRTFFWGSGLWGLAPLGGLLPEVS